MRKGKIIKSADNRWGNGNNTSYIYLWIFHKCYNKLVYRFSSENKYQTLNATAYLENAIPEDAAAIRWLNKI